METVKNIFSAKDLKIGFGRAFHAEPITFDLPSGKLIAVIGKNGAGKSTLLSALCGGEGRCAGEIYVGGNPKPVHLMKPLEVANLIAYVPQEHLFPSHFRVVDLLGLSQLRRVGVWGKMPSLDDPDIQRISVKLNLVDLLLKELGNISAGERQRTFLARAILQRPQVLILDEPTNHLDPSGVSEFWEMIVRLLQEESISVVLSTHDLAFVEKKADHVFALEKGHILFNGSKSAYLAAGIPQKIFGL